jgi:CRISPR system Cascade subunit CasB
MARRGWQDEAFIASLERLRDEENRGALAALRRGLGRPPGTMLSMAPYVEWLRPQPWERTRYYLVAALFGNHPGPRSERRAGRMPTKDRPNIGGMMDEVVRAYEREGVNEDVARKRVEPRFVALLRAHPDDLPRQLMHAVSLAKSKDIAVDYRRLLWDLRYWTSEDRWVQLQWAASFWGGSAPPEPRDVRAEDEEVQDE